MKVYRVILYTDSVEFVRSMFRHGRVWRFRTMTSASKVRLARVMQNCSFETFCSTTTGDLIPFFKPNRAYAALRNYEIVFYDAYRIKEYKMRKTTQISGASLRRILVILSGKHTQISDSSTNWFTTVHYY